MATKLNEVNHQKEVSKAIKIIESYEKQAQGDDVVKSFIGTIPWYERQALDYFFDHCKYDNGVWKANFRTGSYRSNQNQVQISFFISDKRVVEDLMVEAGFLPAEITAIVEQFKDNLKPLGVLLENKMFTPDSIVF